MRMPRLIPGNMWHDQGGEDYEDDGWEEEDYELEAKYLAEQAKRDAGEIDGSDESSSGGLDQETDDEKDEEMQHEDEEEAEKMDEDDGSYWPIGEPLMAPDAVFGSRSLSIL